MNKKRKSLIVLTTIAALFLVAAVVLYFVGYYALSAGVEINQLFNFVINAVTNFNDLLLTIPVLAVAGLWLILSVIWLIVDIKRKKGIVALFVILFLLSAGLVAIYYPYFYDHSAKFTNFVIVELVIAGLAAASYLFFIVLFITDLATGKKQVEEYVVPMNNEEPTEAQPVYEEIKDEEEVAEKVEEAEAEEENEEELEEEEAEEELEDMAEEPKEKKPAPRKKPAKKAPTAPKGEKKDNTRNTQTVLITNEDGAVYAKAYHVSRRAELNKWQVKATGSKKVLKLFNTQKEAIEYAEALAKTTGASVRVHSKTGKIRKHK